MASRGGSAQGRRVTGPSDPQQLRRDTGPQTGKGQARRDQLLVAARAVFEDRGFVDARVADIVAEARVAQGTFYSYFDSKDAIFREVAEKTVEQMMADFSEIDIEPGASQYERVRAGLRRYLQVYRENAMMIALMEQAGTFTPEMRRTRLHVREAWLAQLARSVKRQQAAGVADPNVDPYMIVQVLGAMADHVCYVWFCLGQPYDETEVLDALTTVWARSLGIEDSAAWRLSEG
ncbi:TetR/AcrR family transcriptional regulator [Pseudonocardia lacus]|jgi:AcrR family transcriptional regulator|uniref:TetR/AcrR family transcriptional regulator n=1 Tax=Pseudonocardia lacus TaxID=2835865 RepID=UPI001BDCE5CD|nr:TetR/AcrR family transcriptional regulator [Pseudonocardia lacus]